MLYNYTELEIRLSLLAPHGGCVNSCRYGGGVLQAGGRQDTPSHPLQPALPDGGAGGGRERGECGEAGGGGEGGSTGQ